MPMYYCRMIPRGKDLNKQWEIGFSVREASLDWNRQSHFITVPHLTRDMTQLIFSLFAFSVCLSTAWDGMLPLSLLTMDRFKTLTLL